MSSVEGLQSKSNKKQVLQQSNYNLDTSHKQGNQKLPLEKNVFSLENEKEMISESENKCSSQKKQDKSTRSEAKKLRSIRLGLSSLNRSVIQKVNCDLKSEQEFSSEESSEDVIKKTAKQRPVVPSYVTNSSIVLPRKPRQNKQDALVLSSQNSPKISKAQSLSIARRNARERNRVKQVNEGFAALRDRIPEYISEAHNEEKGKRSAKKLSKVETLRMAVDYIRHLEVLLDLKSTEENILMKQIKTETQPWETPSSSVDYPSPVESRYQPPSVGSPGTSYDQGFEYQERIFYDYDLDFESRKNALISEEKSQTFTVLNRKENENECSEDFKYFETFSKIKKENVREQENLENMENLDILQQETEVPLLPKTKDVIKKASKNTVLPSITESFSNGITVFF